MKDIKAYATEAIGTGILVLGGCGTAVLAANKVGVLGVALAFGLSLLIMAYVIGHISGAHINPAVTIGLASIKKFDWNKVPGYIVAQIIGGILGGLVIYVIATNTPGFEMSAQNFAVNGWGELSPTGVGIRTVFFTEIVMTALLVFAVASTTDKKFTSGFGGIAVGFMLALVHLISIPVDNTSVNPARSMGVAVFVGGQAVNQLWLFFVAPIIGGILGALAYKFISDNK